MKLKLRSHSAAAAPADRRVCIDHCSHGRGRAHHSARRTGWLSVAKYLRV